MSEIYEEPEEPIHEWFGLSYSNYLVLPRSILQSMPIDWQKKFIEITDELFDKCNKLKSMPDYVVLTTSDIDEEEYNTSDDYSNYYKNGQRINGLRNVFEEEEMKR